MSLNLKKHFIPCLALVVATHCGGTTQFTQAGDGPEDQHTTLAALTKDGQTNESTKSEGQSQLAIMAGDSAAATVPLSSPFSPTAAQLERLRILEKQTLHMCTLAAITSGITLGNWAVNHWRYRDTLSKNTNYQEHVGNIKEDLKTLKKQGEKLAESLLAGGSIDDTQRHTLAALDNLSRLQALNDTGVGKHATNLFRSGVSLITILFGGTLATTVIVAASSMPFIGAIPAIFFSVGAGGILVYDGWKTFWSKDQREPLEHVQRFATSLKLMLDEELIAPKDTSKSLSQLKKDINYLLAQIKTLAINHYDSLQNRQDARAILQKELIPLIQAVSLKEQTVKNVIQNTDLLPKVNMELLRKMLSDIFNQVHLKASKTETIINRINAFFNRGGKLAPLNLIPVDPNVKRPMAPGVDPMAFNASKWAEEIHEAIVYYVQTNKSVFIKGGKYDEAFILAQNLGTKDDKTLLLQLISLFDTTSHSDLKGVDLLKSLEIKTNALTHFVIAILENTGPSSQKIDSLQNRFKTDLTINPDYKNILFVNPGIHSAENINNLKASLLELADLKSALAKMAEQLLPKNVVSTVTSKQDAFPQWLQKLLNLDREGGMRSIPAVSRFLDSPQSRHLHPKLDPAHIYARKPGPFSKIGTGFNLDRSDWSDNLSDGLKSFKWFVDFMARPAVWASAFGVACGYKLTQLGRFKASVLGTSHNPLDVLWALFKKIGTEQPEVLQQMESKLQQGDEQGALQTLEQSLTNGAAHGEGKSDLPTDSAQAPVVPPLSPEPTAEEIKAALEQTLASNNTPDGL